MNYDGYVVMETTLGLGKYIQRDEGGRVEVFTRVGDVTFRGKAAALYVNSASGEMRDSLLFVFAK